MSLRKKIVLYVLLFVGCVALVGTVALYNYRYKLCWQCSTQDYYERGKEFVCSDKEELRQTGLDFLLLAADRQQSAAQILLGECYMGDLPEGYSSFDATTFGCLNGQLPRDPTAAARFFNQAYATLRQQEPADNRLPLNFGLLVEKGMIASDNPQQDAHTLYLQAAEQGNYTAMRSLGLEYYKKSDYVAAKKWLSLVAEAGKETEPALLLGDCFYYGKGGVLNYDKAIHWYRVALKTQRILWASAGEDERLAAEDVPMARIDMAMRQLQKNCMRVPMTLHYRISGNATRYIVHTEDRPEGPIGVVEKTDEGITARINNKVTLARSIPTRSKSFQSMNDGMEWMLDAYARSRFGRSAKLNFILKH